MTGQNKKVKIAVLRNFRAFSELLQNGTVFCSLDTETTGLKPDTERLIEISAIKFSKDGILGTFSTFVNPQIPIPERISELTHITDDMVKDAPLAENIISTFLDFIKDTVIVAHNAQFDIRFINAALQRMELPELTNKAVDTLLFSRWVLPENDHWTQSYLAEQHNIQVNAAHRANDDARVCMELFLKLIEISKDYPKNWNRIVRKKNRAQKLRKNAGTPENCSL